MSCVSAIPLLIPPKTSSIAFHGRRSFFVARGRTVEALGLVDSDATVNVMPYELGLQLGATWDDSRAIIQLAGYLGTQPATPFFAMVQVGDVALVQLAFAWTKSPNAPLILGQANFFMEFDVCFYRSKMEFEVKPKSP